MLLDKAEQNETDAILDWSRIQHLCLQRGWDLGQLARVAGISRTTLYHLQSQKTEKPRLSTCFKLAEALQVEPAQLTRQGAEGVPTAPISSIAFESPHKEDGLPLSPSDWATSATFDRQTNWCVQEVCERSPELFQDWSEQEWEELFSSFGIGGELNEQGVLQHVEAINQRRETLYELQILLETHLADPVRRMIHSLYESIQCPDSADPLKKQGA